MSYSIVRRYQDRSRDSRVIRRGLTLEEAQAHCRDPETSSSTCTSEEAKAHTAEHGEWFDGYQQETVTSRHPGLLEQAAEILAQERKDRRC